MTAGLAIYDTMQYILPPISTWCVGQAASMGSLLLASGTPGKQIQFKFYGLRILLTCLIANILYQPRVVLCIVILSYSLMINF